MRSIAPLPSAVSSVFARGPHPTTSASARSCAARPIDPPIKPTPRTAIRTPARLLPARGSDRLRELFAREHRYRLHLAQVVGEFARPQLLRAVADRVLGIR